MSCSKVQTTTCEHTSPITWRSPAPHTPRLTLSRCISRINDLKLRMNNIDNEQMQLLVDLSKLTKDCHHLLEEEKLTLVNGRSELSQEIRLQHKNDSPLRGMPNGQSIDRGQIKEEKKEQICASCGITGHGLGQCVKQWADGFIHGCPRCNTIEHYFDNCIHKSCGDLFFLVKLRDGRPPIRTEMDYRDIKGFESMNERPWTPAFSRKRLSHHESYDYNSRASQRTQIPDPAWLDQDKIRPGTLAYSANRQNPGEALHIPLSPNPLTSPTISEQPNLPTVHGNTSITEETVAQNTTHHGQEGNVAPAAVPTTGESGLHGIEILRPKHRKVDSGRKRFWTACFRGVEVS